MALKDLRDIFPNLVGDRNTITSKPNKTYNCVAWAAKNDTHWWEPYGLILPFAYPPLYWPAGIPHIDSVETYITVFESLGYSVTDNSELEAGVEKLAIYVKDDRFRHVARQLENGKWTSKLGELEDIQHNLEDLISDGPYGYGEPLVFLSKPSV